MERSWCNSLFSSCRWKSSSSFFHQRIFDERSDVSFGIPTTRALSLSLSGEKVARDIMYNGNVDFEQGAVVIRTSETFLRFGHFELLAARNEIDTLQKLTDFTIENYYPEIDKNSK
jgi:uncharacterized protein YdiU (UPF0061 family)